MTDDDVTFGLIYPDTGLTADLFTAVRAGVDARIGLANAAGGIHGRHVSYEWRDDTAVPGINLQAARTLVEQEDV
nr:ABC transporter substrate-binding protein [Micromonospora sp. DSM 115978]